LQLLLATGGNNITFGADESGHGFAKALAVDIPILLYAIRSSLVLVFPYAITGAVIADLFLGLKGVGSLVSYQFRVMYSLPYWLVWYYFHFMYVRVVAGQLICQAN